MVHDYGRPLRRSGGGAPRIPREFWKRFLKKITEIELVYPIFQNNFKIQLMFSRISTKITIAWETYEITLNIFDENSTKNWSFIYFRVAINIAIGDNIIFQQEFLSSAGRFEPLAYTCGRHRLTIAQNYCIITLLFHVNMRKQSKEYILLQNIPIYPEFPGIMEL